MNIFHHDTLSQNTHTQDTLPPLTARQSPWRRVGHSLLREATTDPDLAICQAGLDWQVERVDLRSADTLEAIPDFSAIRRCDTGRYLGVVGADYTPVQNREVFRFFADLAEDKRFTIETAGSFQGGKIVWAMAHLPDLGIHIGDDESKTYLFISNGHTGNKTLTVAPTTIRIICQNTLALAEAQARGRRKHPGLSGGFTVRHTPGIRAALDDIRNAYAQAIASQKTTQQIYQHLASVPLTSQLERQFMTRLFGTPAPGESGRTTTIREHREARLAGILASPTSQVRGTRDSAFSLFQSIVEYVDHDRTTRTHDGATEDESRLVSATQGSGAALKRQAWDSILELAA